MRILSLFLINLLASGLLGAAGGGKAQDPDALTNSESEPINQPLSQNELKASPKAIFQRVVQARLFHDGTWTLDGNSQTPVTAARTLASLQPSFITGLIRLPDHGVLSNAEVEAFSTVRSAVLAANKSCRFDVLINAGDEHSSEVFVRRMKEFTALIHPDAWTFYVDPDTVAVAPEVFEEGVAAAHAAGQMVGYDGPEGQSTTDRHASFQTACSINSGAADNLWYQKLTGGHLLCRGNGYLRPRRAYDGTRRESGGMGISPCLSGLLSIVSRPTCV